VERHRTDLIERRLELLQVVVSAIIIAIAVNILSNVITGQVCVYSVSGFWLMIIAILAMFFSILWLSNIYLGKFILERIQVVLLLDRESGTVMPLDYSPASVASIILRHALKQEPQVLEKFAKELPKRSDPTIRDLVEVLIANWLSTTSMITMTPNGRVISQPIVSPTSKVKSLEVVEVLKKFGDNIFLKIISSDESFNFPAKVRIPHSVTIIARRYEPKGLELGVRVGKRAIFTRIMGGEPGGSELILRGSLLSPLKFFVIRAFTERISDGSPMFLWLSGYPPISKSPDRIICREKVIEGEELAKLRRWIEIDCVLLVGFKMRGYLFWHLNFGEWFRWGEAMIAHAKHYFNFSIYLKRRRPFRHE